MFPISVRSFWLLETLGGCSKPSFGGSWPAGGRSKAGRRAACGFVCVFCIDFEIFRDFYLFCDLQCFFVICRYISFLFRDFHTICCVFVLMVFREFALFAFNLFVFVLGFLHDFSLCLMIVQVVF